MAEMFDSEDEDMSIENDAVMTKYKLAGEISNTVSAFFMNWLIAVYTLHRC